MSRFLKRIYQTLLCANQPNTCISIEGLENLAYKRKRILLKTCLYITFIMLFFFSTLHAFVYQSISNSAFILELFTGLVALYAIMSLNRNPSRGNTDKIAQFATLAFAVFLLLFVDLNQNENFSLIWVFFFPVFALVINGPKIGLRYALVFLAVLLTLAYNGIGQWQEGLWSELGFIRLTAALFILTFIIYINEISLLKARQQAKQVLDELQTLSTIDELTKISNRRNINTALSKAIKNAERYETPLSLTLFDIDNFKGINDQYGHLIGDSVLSEMVQEIKPIIRATDEFGRWGGEEFLIVLPHETLESASLFCEKVRVRIENSAFSESAVHITCSFGVAQLQKGMTAEQLIDQADQALYAAKQAGKNQVRPLHKRMHG
ncbi:MAG: GGDEF domain-containing protein [Thiomicrorhabdus sp.]|nr:GGDEF domain-containing protein [Thiomicrorhabdus sp.]